MAAAYLVAEGASANEATATISFGKKRTDSEPSRTRRVVVAGVSERPPYNLIAWLPAWTGTRSDRARLRSMSLLILMFWRSAINSRAKGCPKGTGHLFDCPECHEDAFRLIIMGATWVARIMIINLDPGIDGLKSSRCCSCC